MLPGPLQSLNKGSLNSYLYEDVDISGEDDTVSQEAEAGPGAAHPGRGLLVTEHGAVSSGQAWDESWRLDDRDRAYPEAWGMII